MTKPALVYNSGFQVIFMSDTVTLAVNVGSDADRYLIVAFNKWDKAVSNVKYNGNDLTKIVSLEPYLDVWTLKNPDAGTNDLIITLNGKSTQSSFVVSSWKNVNQNTPIGTIITDVSGAPVFPLNVTSEVGDVVVDAIAGMQNSNTPACDQTLIAAELTNGTSASNIGHSQKDGSAGSTGMSWTWTEGYSCNRAGFALKPSGSSPALAVVKKSQPRTKMDIKTKSRTRR